MNVVGIWVFQLLSRLVVQTYPSCQWQQNFLQLPLLATRSSTVEVTMVALKGHFAFRFGVTSKLLSIFSLQLTLYLDIAISLSCECRFYCDVLWSLVPWKTCQKNKKKSLIWDKKHSEVRATQYWLAKVEEEQRRKSKIFRWVNNFVTHSSSFC